MPQSDWKSMKAPDWWAQAMAGERKSCWSTTKWRLVIAVELFDAKRASSHRVCVHVLRLDESLLLGAHSGACLMRTFELPIHTYIQTFVRASVYMLICRLFYCFPLLVCLYFYLFLCGFRVELSLTAWQILFDSWADRLTTVTPTTCIHK